MANKCGGKWKRSLRTGDDFLKKNAERLADMQAGVPVWGNPCEVRGCLTLSSQWVEVDGVIHTVCDVHRN